MSDRLATGDVAGYLVERGLLAAGVPARAGTLSGGVSNLVHAVHATSGHWVVKQSLGRLRVADEWLAPRERILAEGLALELTGRLTPGAVPPVIDRDDGAFALVIEHAPDGWTEWKARLLRGETDPGVAGRLGQVLGRWHAATWGGQGLPARFHDPAAFVALRVDPYHRTVTARRPELAGAVDPLVERMLAHPTCLVHGDFSPKNVLVGPASSHAAASGTRAGWPPPGAGADGRRGEPRQLWVTDMEVAHYGDPVFDLAFLLTHLVLKSVHRPAARGGYHDCARAFLDTYTAIVGAGRVPEPAYLFGHVGCLLAARVDGKSPAEYLTEPGRRTVRNLADGVLADPPASLAELWRRLEVTGGT